MACITTAAGIRRGHPVTYCATGPALCVPGENWFTWKIQRCLPDSTTLVCYEAPDELPVDETQTDQLPDNWKSNQTVTQQIGDGWLDGAGGCLFRVPSVIVPIAESDDRNILINHRHEAAMRITVSYTRIFRIRSEALHLRLRATASTPGGAPSDGTWAHGEGDRVGDLQAVAGEAHEVSGVVGDEPELAHAQVAQDLGADAEVAEVPCLSGFGGAQALAFGLEVEQGRPRLPWRSTPWTA